MLELARALVQDRVLTPEAAARAEQAARGGDVASAALELRLADEADLVRTVARLRECPGLDLSRSIVPADNLGVVELQFCREHRLLPASVGKGEVVLAMADPDDLAAADEVRFLTARKVLRYAAVGSAIARALEGLARARHDGVPVWAGERATDGAPTLAVVKPAVRPARAIEVPGAAPGAALPAAPPEMEVVGLAELISPFQPAAAPAPSPAPPPAPPPPSGPATVRIEGLAVGKVTLVADDDAGVRLLVATVLSKMGCLVLQAGDGKTALQTVREARPDLVVLDAMMPGMHGFDVCRAIKADRTLRATRVVLCSAIYRGTVGSDAQVAFGADAFVEKPFRLEELTRVFKVALVGPAAAETAEERAAREEAQALWRSAAEALSLGRLPQAAELARSAASKDPWSAEAHYYLGHALARQNQLFEAVAAYERAAELRPDVDATHQCLAQTYERLGFQKSSREAWARAVETCRDPARKKALQARLIAMLG